MPQLHRPSPPITNHPTTLHLQHRPSLPTMPRRLLPGHPTTSHSSSSTALSCLHNLGRSISSSRLLASQSLCMCRPRSPTTSRPLLSTRGSAPQSMSMKSLPHSPMPRLPIARQHMLSLAPPTQSPVQPTPPPAATPMPHLAATPTQPLAAMTTQHQAATPTQPPAATIMQPPAATPTQPPAATPTQHLVATMQAPVERATIQ